MKKENTEIKQPSVNLNGQYIKELYFYNANSPASFLPAKEQPKIEIAINFNNRDVNENVYEVILVIKANAKSQDEGNLQLFDVKLAYAGLVALNNIDDKTQKEAILHVHVPTLLFPYARHVLSDITRDGGFQPLTLEPMDFGRLHEQRKKQREEESTGDEVN